MAFGGFLLPIPIQCVIGFMEFDLYGLETVYDEPRWDLALAPFGYTILLVLITWRTDVWLRCGVISGCAARIFLGAACFGVLS